MKRCSARARHVGRNDPCPCGSGKKAKKCCLANGEPPA
ncbi:SEC-C metal-binding domain-containing protein [Bradyrhizobium retamae]